MNDLVTCWYQRKVLNGKRLSPKLLLKKELAADEKQEVLEMIDAYHRGDVPLIVPITLLNHYVRKFEQPYLRQQYYLHPHPLDLRLRSHFWDCPGRSSILLTIVVFCHRNDLARLLMAKNFCKEQFHVPCSVPRQLDSRLLFYFIKNRRVRKNNQDLQHRSHNISYCYVQFPRIVPLSMIENRGVIPAWIGYI